MPIQTFNTFPRPIPDSSGLPGFPFGYVPQTVVTTTSSSTTYATVLQLNGAGYIAAIVVNGPTAVPSTRVTWDDTNITPDMVTSATGANVSLGANSITGAVSADSSGREFGLFFSRNAKVEFKWGGAGAAATIWIFYYLAGGGAKKYRTLYAAANPAVGADLVNVSGSGSLNFIWTSGGTLDITIDSVLVRAANAYVGAVGASIAVGNSSGTGNDRANEKLPFAKQLKLTKVAAPGTMHAMYTIEVNN